MRSERIDRKDIILISIDLTGEEINLNQICRRWGITEKTLFKYFNEMDRSGQVLYRRTDSETFIRLTDSGRNELKGVYDIISEIILDPITSGFAKKVNLNTVLDHLKNPYEKLEFLDRFFLKKESNATIILEDIKAMRSDSRFSRYIEEVLSIESDSDIKALEKKLRSSSIYGVSPKESRLSGQISDHDPDCLLLRAEVLKRAGSTVEAKTIYDGLLARTTGIDPARWLLCVSGSFQCMLYDNRESEVISLLDSIIESVDNPIEKGFLKKIKADTIQDFDKFEEASLLYKSCLGLFNSKKYPVIRASTLNNLGVLYFRKNDLDNALSLWEEAYKIVIQEKMTWSRIMTSINLADAYSLRGNTSKAMRLLGKARTFLKDIGDLEGLSDVDFNMALVQIEKGDIKRAWKYFEAAESFPLIYEKKRVERRNVFEGRLKARKQ
jgi:tetratricopeptide (TPR) repeat protein/predicted transcriptional regulator